MKKYNIIFSYNFLKELDEISKYYYNFSELYVETLLNDIEKVSNIICYFPYVAPTFYKNENIRNIVIKNRFNIIYKIDKNRIEFIHIIDGRMQNNNLELNETVELIYQI